MIICKVCEKETNVPMRGEFLCFSCYDKQTREKIKSTTKNTPKPS